MNATIKKGKKPIKAWLIVLIAIAAIVVAIIIAFAWAIYSAENFTKQSSGTVKTENWLELQEKYPEIKKMTYADYALRNMRDDTYTIKIDSEISQELIDDIRKEMLIELLKFYMQPKKYQYKKNKIETEAKEEVEAWWATLSAVQKEETKNRWQPRKLSVKITSKKSKTSKREVILRAYTEGIKINWTKVINGEKNTDKEGNTDNTDKEYMNEE